MKRVRVVNPGVNAAEETVVAAPVETVAAPVETVAAPVVEATPKTGNGINIMAMSPEQRAANLLKAQASRKEKIALGRQNYTTKSASNVLADTLAGVVIAEASGNTTTEVSIDAIITKYVNAAISLDRQNQQLKAENKPVTPITVSATKADMARITRLVTVGIIDALSTSSIKLEGIETDIILSNLIELVLKASIIPSVTSTLVNLLNENTGTFTKIPSLFGTNPSW
jgi:hypothetical protein